MDLLLRNARGTTSFADIANLRPRRDQVENRPGDQMIVQHNFSGTKDPHGLHGQEIGISRTGSHQINLTFHDWLVHVSHPAAGVSQRPCSDGLGAAASCKYNIIRLALVRSVGETE